MKCTIAWSNAAGFRDPPRSSEQIPASHFFGIDPDDATWYRGNDRLHEKLRALGIPMRSI